jgi:hypothetical protein
MAITVKGVCASFLLFITVFSVTFMGLWYFTQYKKIVHAHILTPLYEEIHLWPQYKKFFDKYNRRFNIVYRNVSGDPIVLFLDHNYNQIEVHNITHYQSEEIADLLRSRGFADEEITADHPGFREAEEYYKSLKDQMDPEEYKNMVQEVESLIKGPEKDTAAEAAAAGKTDL